MLDDAISKINSLANENGIVTTNDVNLSIDLILEDLKDRGIPIYADNKIKEFNYAH